MTDSSDADEENTCLGLTSHVSKELIGCEILLYHSSQENALRAIQTTTIFRRRIGPSLSLSLWCDLLPHNCRGTIMCMLSYRYRYSYRDGRHNDRDFTALSMTTVACQAWIWLAAEVIIDHSVCQLTVHWSKSCGAIETTNKRQKTACSYHRTPCSKSCCRVAMQQFRNC